MQGFPRHLNGRNDYENIVRDFGWHCPEVKAAYQALLVADRHYVFDRVLATGEQPDGPEPEYRVMEERMPDGTIKRAQFKLIDNPNSKLKQLGFARQEVEEVINHA